jgi:Ala-tRNA(Pro) deacylase
MGDEASLLARLDALGIAYALTRHPPVMTVDEARVVRPDLGVCHVKNLFLRDKKGAMVLLTAERDQPVDLKSLRFAIGATGAITFGSHDRLRTYLGIEPGSVTPLAAMNDAGGQVRVLLDATIRDAGAVAVHPLHNAATLVLSSADLVRFLADIGHPPTWVRFGPDGSAATIAG